MSSIEDQTGQRYVVFEGDPARALCDRLTKRGVREIVLPRETLITGRLVELSIPGSLAKWDVSKPEVAEMFRRYVRLRDCMGYLCGSNRPDTKIAVGSPPAVGSSQDHAAG